MDVVSAVKRDLIERIGQERYDLWFSTSVRLEVAADAVVVEAGDPFLLERLRKQFHSDLHHVAREAGEGRETVFRVDASLRRTAGLSTSKSESARPGARTPGHAVAALPLRPPGEAAPIGRRKFAALSAFVVGDANRVAYTAAHSVAGRPGSVSPLFLYGPAGSGKTHLLEGIWSQMRAAGNARVLFLSAEQFTTYFLEALRGGGLPSFRRKCREVDMLAVDDVQFFAGKKATLIELQHTIDALLRHGRQMVLAADRPPSSLPELGTELITRFSGGLVCGLDHADYATRLEIARRKAQQLEVPISDAVLELISRELMGDARQIHGALHRLEATGLALRQTITVPLAEHTLRDVFRATQRVVRLDDIEKAVCDTFGLDARSLREGGKTKAISQPRMLAMWLARKYTRAASTEISEFFGRRSHSTVISAEKKVNRWMTDDTAVQLGHQSCPIREAVQRVETRLRTG